MASQYESWSKEDLIARLIELEAAADSPPSSNEHSTSSLPPAPPPPLQPASPIPTSLLATPSSSTSSLASTLLDLKVPRHIRRGLLKKKDEKRTPVPFSDYPRRKIALKLSYLGSPYCGLTSQGTAITPLPTVEGVLKEALEKASLIEAGRGWDGCLFARCGRTDRGVSAAGQVVSFWVKSRMGYDPEIHEPRPEGKIFFGELGYGATEGGGDASTTSTQPETEDPSLPGVAPRKDKLPKEENGSIRVEYPYLNILNKLLPPTIRILAWSPLHPASEFDARYSCSYRHYKYFFSLNATPSGPDTDGRVLDIEKMQEAASYLIGEHDFRNFCKIDGSKQITNFTRRIHSATISPVNPITSRPFVPSPYSAISPTHLDPDASLVASQPPPQPGQFFVLDLLGRAFLYHQVRHIMAILFLVGAGLEEPSIVEKLIEWEFKPTYEMADGEPLLLWDCGFPEGLLHWQYGIGAPGERELSVEAAASANASKKGSSDKLTGGEANQRGGDYGYGAPDGKDFILTYANLSTAMLAVSHSTHLNTLLHSHFHSALIRLHPTLLLEPPNDFSRRKGPAKVGEPDLVKTPLGGNQFKIEGARTYPGLEGRSRSESFEVANERYRARMLNRFGTEGKPKKWITVGMGAGAGGGSGSASGLSSGVATPVVMEGEGEEDE